MKFEAWIKNSMGKFILLGLIGSFAISGCSKKEDEFEDSETLSLQTPGSTSQTIEFDFNTFLRITDPDGVSNHPFTANVNVTEYRVAYWDGYYCDLYLGQDTTISPNQPISHLNCRTQSPRNNFSYRVLNIRNRVRRVCATLENRDVFIENDVQKTRLIYSCGIENFNHCQLENILLNESNTFESSVLSCTSYEQTLANKTKYEMTRGVEFDPEEDFSEAAIQSPFNTQSDGNTGINGATVRPFTGFWEGLFCNYYKAQTQGLSPEDVYYLKCNGVRASGVPYENIVTQLGLKDVCSELISRQVVLQEDNNENNNENVNNNEGVNNNEDVNNNEGANNNEGVNNNEGANNNEALETQLIYNCPLVQGDFSNSNGGRCTLTETYSGVSITSESVPTQQEFICRNYEGEDIINYETEKAEPERLITLPLDRFNSITDLDGVSNHPFNTANVNTDLNANPNAIEYSVAYWNGYYCDLYSGQKRTLPNETISHLTCSTQPPRNSFGYTDINIEHRVQRVCSTLSNKTVFVENEVQKTRIVYNCDIKDFNQNCQLENVILSQGNVFESSVLSCRSYEPTEINKAKYEMPKGIEFVSEDFNQDEREDRDRHPFDVNQVSGSTVESYTGFWEGLFCNYYKALTIRTIEDIHYLKCNNERSPGAPYRNIVTRLGLKDVCSELASRDVLLQEERNNNNQNNNEDGNNNEIEILETQFIYNCPLVQGRFSSSNDSGCTLTEIYSGVSINSESVPTRQEFVCRSYGGNEIEDYELDPGELEDRVQLNFNEFANITDPVGVSNHPFNISNVNSNTIDYKVAYWNGYYCDLYLGQDRNSREEISHLTCSTQPPRNSFNYEVIDLEHRVQRVCADLLESGGREVFVENEVQKTRLRYDCNIDRLNNSSLTQLECQLENVVSGQADVFESSVLSCRSYEPTEINKAKYEMPRGIEFASEDFNRDEREDRIRHPFDVNQINGSTVESYTGFWEGLFCNYYEAQTQANSQRIYYLKCNNERAPDVPYRNIVTRLGLKDVCSDLASREVILQQGSNDNAIERLETKVVYNCPLVQGRFSSSNDDRCTLTETYLGVSITSESVPTRQEFVCRSYGGSDIENYEEDMQDVEIENLIEIDALAYLLEKQRETANYIFNTSKTQNKTDGTSSFEHRTGQWFGNGLFCEYHEAILEKAQGDTTENEQGYTNHRKVRRLNCSRRVPKLGATYMQVRNQTSFEDLCAINVNDSDSIKIFTETSQRSNQVVTEQQCSHIKWPSSLEPQVSCVLTKKYDGENIEDGAEVLSEKILCYDYKGFEDEYKSDITVLKVPLTNQQSQGGHLQGFRDQTACQNGCKPNGISESDLPFRLQNRDRKQHHPLSESGHKRYLGAWDGFLCHYYVVHGKGSEGKTHDLYCFRNTREESEGENRYTTYYNTGLVVDEEPTYDSWYGCEKENEKLENRKAVARCPGYVSEGVCDSLGDDEDTDNDCDSVCSEELSICDNPQDEDGDGSFRLRTKDLDVSSTSPPLILYGGVVKPEGHVYDMPARGNLDLIPYTEDDQFSWWHKLCRSLFTGIELLYMTSMFNNDPEIYKQRQYPVNYVPFRPFDFNFHWGVFSGSRLQYGYRDEVISFFGDAVSAWTRGEGNYVAPENIGINHINAFLGLTDLLNNGILNRLQLPWLPEEPNTNIGIANRWACGLACIESPSSSPECELCFSRIRAEEKIGGTSFPVVRTHTSDYLGSVEGNIYAPGISLDGDCLLEDLAIKERVHTDYHFVEWASLFDICVEDKRTYVRNYSRTLASRDTYGGGAGYCGTRAAQDTIDFETIVDYKCLAIQDSSPNNPDTQNNPNPQSTHMKCFMRKTYQGSPSGSENPEPGQSVLDPSLTQEGQDRFNEEIGRESERPFGSGDLKYVEFWCTNDDDKSLNPGEPATGAKKYFKYLDPQ